MNPSTVVVGLSGGVDSAIAASLLLEQGYTVEALFMKNWDEDDEEGYCPAEQDLSDARAVAALLGIKLHTVSFSGEYWNRVFAYFLDEYRAGRTPNPDILCNQEIKFKAFLDYALDLGASHIATGHYARIDGKHDHRRLLKGQDANKDQSYFLYRLNQRALNHSLFPLGDMEKSRVRAIAADKGFPNASKKDSTGICFIGERKFNKFLERYLPSQPGNIETLEGNVMGHHKGLMFHTIGQRQGLGIGGIKGTSGDPWYVVDKDLEQNRLIVAQGKNHPELFKPTLLADDLHWINTTPTLPLPCHARIRYRQADQACTLKAIDNGIARVSFEQSQRAVTPGQAIVFYTGDHCLGGGTILS